jgi:catechol 2,3-dioxygenase-like lactoylglutathione lyase family enzyme
LPRPAFSFPGAWFRLGGDQELHIIQGDPDPAGAKPISRGNHYALLVDSITAAADHLREKGVAFTGPKKRPDGASQIFFNDPDGHTIELCTPPA